MRSDGKNNAAVSDSRGRARQERATRMDDAFHVQYFHVCAEWMVIVTENKSSTMVVWPGETPASGLLALVCAGGSQ